MRRLLLAAAVWASGCSAVLDFHECDVSADCASRQPDGGAPLYCNFDHQCVDTTPCQISVAADPKLAGTPLVVAGLYKLTRLSPDDPDDHAIAQASDLAASELNDRLGVPVTHVRCDTAGDPAQAARAYSVAVKQFHAVAVVGPDTSGEVIKGVAPLVKPLGAVVVSPSATNPAIAALDDANLIWRTCPSDNLQAKVLATLVPSTATLDIVYVQGNTYAEGLRDAFIAASGRQDALPIGFASGSASSAVQQMNAPAYALLIADVDAPALVQALDGAPGQGMTQYLMTDSALAPTLWGNAPYDFTFLQRIRGTAPALPAFTDASGPVYATFATSYKAKFNGEDPADTAFVANAYDAFYAIAIAAGALGGAPTGAQIAARLGTVSDPAAPAVTVGPNAYTNAVGTLANGTINLVGTSGPIDFDGNGDVVSAPIEVWHVAAGSNGAPTFNVDAVETP